MTTRELQAVPAGTWSVDRVHSNVGFSVEYMAGTFTGTFSDFDVSVADGVLRGEAKVASVQVTDPNLEAHLQTPDFFDAERYPELAFVSRSINRSGDELAINGDVTIKGHTEPIELTATITEPIADPYGGTRYGLRLIRLPSPRHRRAAPTGTVRLCPAPRPLRQGSRDRPGRRGAPEG